MKVTVEYAAQVRKATGIATEQVEIADGGSVQDLANAVADAHPTAKSVLLTEEATLHASILVFVDDQQVRDTATQLSDGQNVTLLSPISGG